MSWINVSTCRAKLTAQTEESLRKWKDVDDVLGIYTIGIMALMTGRQDLIDPILALCEKWELGYLPSEDKFLEKFMDFPTVLNFSLLSHLNGKNQEELWEKLLLVNCKNKTAKLLQKFLKDIVEDSYTGFFSKKGHLIDTKDWYEILKKGEIEYLWNVVSCPDHPLWKKNLSTFYLPILILYHSFLQKKGYNYTLLDICANKMEELTGEILYEKANDIPEGEGVDAISIANDHLYVYHFLGFKWKLPLIYPPAFSVLEDSTLQKCIASLAPKVVKEIERLQELGNCTYVILHDSTHAMPVEKETLKAKNKYPKLDFVTQDITSFSLKNLNE